jgi:hypothetical protein
MSGFVNYEHEALDGGRDRWMDVQNVCLRAD